MEAHDTERRRCDHLPVPMLFVATSSAYMEPAKGSAKDAYVTLLMVEIMFIYVSVFLIFVMCGFALWFRGAMGGSHDIFNLQRNPNLDHYVVLFKNVLKNLPTDKAQEQDLIDMLEELQVYDLNVINTVMTIFVPILPAPVDENGKELEVAKTNSLRLSSRIQLPKANLDAVARRNTFTPSVPAPKAETPDSKPAWS